MEIHAPHRPSTSSVRPVAQLVGSTPARPTSLAATSPTRLRAGLSRLAVPLGLGGLVLAAFLVYLPSLDDFFAADDFVFLQAANRHDFREYVWRAITFPYGEPFDLEPPFWRPLVDA